MEIIEAIHELDWADLPEAVQARARLCLTDLVAVGAGGARTPLAGIIARHAEEAFGGPHRVPFSGARASAEGVALATGMTIDALDGHDGYNPAKGHAGCGALAGIVGLAQRYGITGGRDLLTALVLGYELGCRFAVTQHASTADYHTSGAWIATTVAAIGARMAGLTPEATEHAMGIAEYHGPRSQMMRCIDHPTMLKDGSGWGAMAGVSAAALAARGFTGAPALTARGDAWEDLGRGWRILDQYFKPWPVCRWAQAPVEAVLRLRDRHGIGPADVAALRVETFHESIRLASREPRTTEEAQYSTSFPCAVALVHGDVRPEHLMGDGLADPEVLRLSRAMAFEEDPAANAAFPGRRTARVTLTLRDGRSLSSDWLEARWEADAPPGREEIAAKARVLMDPALGPVRTKAALTALQGFESGGLGPLLDVLCQPMSRSTTAARSA